MTTLAPRSFTHKARRRRLSGRSLARLLGLVFAETVRQLLN